MSQYINLTELNVQVVTNNAGVFCGRNLQVAWTSVTKNNHGHGVISGDGNIIPANLNTLHDQDLVDSAPIFERTRNT